MSAKAKLEPVAEHCEDCRYFLKYDPEDLAELPEDDEDALTGVCRRYPPQIMLSYPEPVAAHPDVAGVTGWCGEFTPV